MTMKLANGLRDPILDAVATALNGGVIEIYSGPQPVAANDAPTGTLLGVVTKDGAPWTAGSPTNGLTFKPAVNGLLEKSDDQWRFTGIAKGTAGYWRAKGNALDDGSVSDDLPRMDGVCGVNAGELRLSTTSIDVGTPVTIDSFKLRMPAQ